MSDAGVLGALLVAVGGGAGSIARFVLDTWATGRARRPLSASARPRFPWGITIVNLSGSFLLGLLVGMLHAPGLEVATHPAWLALGVGVLGGYTTLSTASLDTVRLARAGRLVAAAANALGTLGVAVLLAIAGIFLGIAIA